MWKWILLVAVSFDRLRPVSAGETLPPRRAPRISDEEENTLAEKFQCPACTAVFWELDHALKTAESSPLRSAAKVAENSPLTESEYIDVFEQACDYHKKSPLYAYVIRVNSSGHNVLTGRGLFPPEPQPSFFRGKMPMLLSQKCLAVVGGHGEDEMYATYRALSREQWFDTACGEVCRNHGRHFLMPRLTDQAPTAKAETKRRKKKVRRKVKKSKRKKKTAPPRVGTKREAKSHEL